jgi:hypothetical protein
MDTFLTDLRLKFADQQQMFILSGLSVSRRRFFFIIISSKQRRPSELKELGSSRPFLITKLTEFR